MRRTPLPAALAVVTAALCACDGDEKAQRGEETVVAATGEAPPGADPSGWLAANDATDPALWLAQRSAKAPLSEDDPRVAALRGPLAAARAHFVEDARMIANRTAQLGAMLAEADHPEDHAALVVGLTEVAAAGGRRQLYGEMVQHYYNTRRLGADRATALARLAERYGAQAAR